MTSFEATVRAQSTGVGKREKEGKETSVREQPGRTSARQEREAAEKRQERSTFTCRGRMLTLKEEKEKREESGESGDRSCGGSILPLHVKLLLSWRFSAASLSLSLLQRWFVLAALSRSFFSLLSPSSQPQSTVSVRTVALKARHEADSLSLYQVNDAMLKHSLAMEVLQVLCSCCINGWLSRASIQYAILTQLGIISVGLLPGGCICSNNKSVSC